MARLHPEPRTIRRSGLHLERLVLPVPLTVSGIAQLVCARTLRTGPISTLTDRPDVCGELRQNLELVPAFIEELLRLESPVQGHFRRVTEDVDIHGVRIPEGALVNIPR
jgi:cytochrome P450 family 144